MNSNKSKLLIFVAVILTGNISSSFGDDVASVAEIYSTAQEVSNLVAPVVNAGNSLDAVAGGALNAGTIYSEPLNYLAGSTIGINELVSELRQVGSNALSASSGDVGTNGSVSSMASGNGYAGGQKGPISYVEDILKTEITENVDYDCVEYMYIGQCWWIKTSFPYGFGSNPVAENLVGDLQVEVTRRSPSDSVGIFEVADNAPTDTLSGSIIQNTAAIFGRIMDSLYSAGPDMQFQENQSAITNPSNPNQFLEAMVIGNPTLGLTTTLWASLPGYCVSSASAYTPYFVSSLDAYSWRILATTDALLLAVYTADYGGWNQVGSLMGSVFPRMGYVENPEEFNASVTVAYRALSIVSDLRPTYSGAAGLHIGTPTPAYAAGSLSNKSDMKYRTVRDHSSQLLRMTFPEQGDTCTNYSGMSKVKTAQENAKFMESNKYASAAFKVYRPYVCCKKKHTYLYTTVFISPSFERY